MHEIVEKERLNEEMTRIEVKAPLVADKIKPGQFIVIRMHEKGERIPLTFYKKDEDKGTIQMIFQKMGKSTHELDTYEEGDEILDVVGPMGTAAEIEEYGTVVCIGGGVGTPEVFPVAKALRNVGNEVIVISGFRTEDLVVCENELDKDCANELYITTDDGTYGREGFTTDVLEELIDQGTDIDLIHAVGPPIMMKVIAGITEEHDIPTRVSLNSIMLDATGMCGSCRVEIDGEMKLACVDGPEFDAHKVNFEELMERITMFEEQEEEALENWKEEHEGCCG
ncbi:MAG: sulfide/dihydroorotate dehydrogenase-like FAD/NAD-binding protein [Candidatus Thermoplasmatota archaeon]|nr:sulfide/dihydroorotate dehydrogenase-like FAD/NAD-binding protein [Candidatus Thermoplasmatota archaeon]MBS3790566.1 sulfide/dihydroorotate dehydrogenase-like FAD/NAD-binding protein [Candidatus Thermoplasmatota archaeon]